MEVEEDGDSQKTENEKGSKDHLEIAPCRSTKDFLLDTDCYDVIMLSIYVK